CAREARKIGAETVTQIHHGVDAEVFREPARFVNPWDESKMLSAQRSAETSGDKKIVAFFPARARDAAILFHETGHTDRNRSRSARGARFAANDNDIELRRGAFQAAIKFFDP